MQRATARTATTELSAINALARKKSEVKWNSANSFGGVIQRAYIDYLFQQIAQKRMHFHIRFSPMNEYDHAASGPRKRIDTVSKSFYQLIKHRGIRHYDMHDIFVIPDDGDCTSQLVDHLGALNYASSSWEGSIKSIRPRSSASEPMLQLLDVTLGALAAMRNGRAEPHHTGTKAVLSRHAFALTGWPDIAGNCPPSARELSRWNVRPRFGK